jgi:hypothetical protein
VPTDLDGLANIAGKYHLRSGYLNNRKQLGQAGISNLLAEEILNPEKLGILAGDLRKRLQAQMSHDPASIVGFLYDAHAPEHKTDGGCVDVRCGLDESGRTEIVVQVSEIRTFLWVVFWATSSGFAASGLPTTESAVLFIIAVSLAAWFG